MATFKNNRKRCSEAGCKEIITYGRYCSNHQKLHSKFRAQTEQFNKFYKTRAWIKTSVNYRKLEPWCEHCLQDGIRTLATEVDHIIELRDGGLEFDHSNLQSLCHRCHMMKTEQERQKRNGRL